MMQNNIVVAADCDSVVDLLRWRARQHPQRIAYTFLLDGEADAMSVTYAELDRQARAIGALLQSFSATGQRALLLYPPGLDYIAAFFGCLYAGVVATPAYPPLPNRPMSRIQAIIKDARAALLLTTTPILASIEQQFAQNPAPASPRGLATDRLPEHIEDHWQAPVLSRETLAFLQYTSGSTTTPKGVMVSHGNLLANELIIERAFEHTAEAIVVGWLPLYHDMGLIGNVLQPIYIGSHSILMSPLAFLQRPLRWLQAISHYRAHSSGGPNFAYELCVNKITPEQRATLDLSSWRVAFNGAEPIRHTTLERFVEAFAPCGFRREAFYPCYGLAEATLLVTGGLRDEPPIVQGVQSAALEDNRVDFAPDTGAHTRTLVGCGRTWLGQQAVIVDPETCVRCPEDQVGEIWVAGSSVAQGYWNRVAETEHTFRAYLAGNGEGPFLRTGDLGFLRDGELFVTGRLKDLIIIEGRNHYPQDIELTVEQCHAALRPGCSAAFSVDIDGSEQVVAVAEVERHFVTAQQQGDAAHAVAEVVKAIRQAVSRHHDLQLHSVLLLKTGSIPKTSSGKIQRHACRNGFLGRSLEVVGM